MSNAKHTPGPWSCESTNGWLWIWGAGKQRIVMSVSNESELKDDVLVENEANAKLIAAAPELLEVVTTLYVTMKNNGFNGGHWKKHLDQMNAAIKKATDE